MSLDWRVYFLQTMTGLRGPMIQRGEGSPWTRDLNAADNVSVTMTKANLKGIDPEWWQPLRNGLLVTLVIDGVEEPFMAGVFMDAPEETQDTVTFSADGINAMLAGRTVLDGEFFNYDARLSVEQAKALSKSKVSRVGFSLGTIMQEIITLSIEKAGGFLPIRFGTPREAAPGLNQRNYHGWNLANIGSLKLLEELSQVINGPDFMFRPEWSPEDPNLVVWVLYNGTARQQAIHQTWTMSIDTTAPSAGVTNVNVKGSKASYANRAYWTGAGEDAGTLIRGYQDMAELEAGMPLVEYVGSTSDSENPDLIQTHAESHVKNNKYPLAQVSCDLNASDMRYRLDRWHVGDAAEVTVKGWLNIPDGTHTLRIISASGAVGSDIVSVEFALEVIDGQEV